MEERGCEQRHVKGNEVNFPTRTSEGKRAAVQPRGRLGLVFAVFIFLIGVCVVAYPAVSDWWNARVMSSAIQSYDESCHVLRDEQRDALWQDAVAYNRELFEADCGYELPESLTARYSDMLSTDASGIMGYVEIPSIGVELPLYHGTGEDSLQIGAGHLEWTSLPTGGVNTHCVISGHTGLPSARLFTDLDELAEGDVFYVHVLGHVMEYRVYETQIVLPAEVANLMISPGRDLCTLLTCTPYGQNTHRLLVHGERVL